LGVFQPLHKMAAEFHHGQARRVVILSKSDTFVANLARLSNTKRPQYFLFCASTGHLPLNFLAKLRHNH
jgi:hypothetical protein